jgi:hypothetical protein
MRGVAGWRRLREFNANAVMAAWTSVVVFECTLLIFVASLICLASVDRHFGTMIAWILCSSTQIGARFLVVYLWGRDSSIMLRYNGVRLAVMSVSGLVQGVGATLFITSLPQTLQHGYLVLLSAAVISSVPILYDELLNYAVYCACVWLPLVLSANGSPSITLAFAVSSATGLFLAKVEARKSHRICNEEETVLSHLSKVEDENKRLRMQLTLRGAIPDAVDSVANHVNGRILRTFRCEFAITNFCKPIGDDAPCCEAVVPIVRPQNCR